MITQEGHSGLSPQSFWKIQGLYFQNTRFVFAGNLEVRVNKASGGLVPSLRIHTVSVFFTQVSLVRK